MGESLGLRLVYPYIWRDILMEQGKLVEAEQHLAAALAIELTESEQNQIGSLRFQLAQVLEKQGRIAEALGEARMASDELAANVDIKDWQLAPAKALVEKLEKKVRNR